MAGTYAWFKSGSVSIALLSAIVSGWLVGVVTSMLHTYGQITKLLSGILMFTMLYSVNLHFFNKPNVTLPEVSEQYQFLPFYVDVVILFMLYYLLMTCLGKSLRVHGSNQRIHDEFSISTPILLGVGMGISSSLVALSGFLTALYFGFSDSQLGFGVLVHGVAGILIGEVLGAKFRILTPLFSIFAGIFIYSFIVFMVLSMLPDSFFMASDTKLLSGIIVIIVLVLNKNKKIELTSI